LKEYLLNDPSQLNSKYNNYLDTFITTIFESIDLSLNKNETNMERYQKNKKIIIDLIANIFNHNKMIIKELLEINLNILGKNDNINVNQNGKLELTQLIETVFIYNINNLYQNE
jgi:hypothetical protein